MIYYNLKELGMGKLWYELISGEYLIYLYNLLRF